MSAPPSESEKRMLATTKRRRRRISWVRSSMGRDCRGDRSHNLGAGRGESNSREKAQKTQREEGEGRKIHHRDTEGTKTDIFFTEDSEGNEEVRPEPLLHLPPSLLGSAFVSSVSPW